MGFLDKIYSIMGSARRSYDLAKAGTAERPQFLTSWAEGERWRGGDLGNKDAAERRAIQSSWVYVAIRFKVGELIAAKPKLALSGGGPDDESIPLKNHPLASILEHPNPYMGGAFLQEYSHWWQELDGNFYWFLALDNQGRLAEIWPLPANKVQPMPGDKERFIDHYEYQASGAIYRIPAEYICHVQYPNPFDIFRGLSPLVAGMLPVDSDLAMAHWNGRFFGVDNVMPSAVISLSSGNPGSPINPTDIEAFKDELKSDYSAFNRKTLVTNAYDMAVQQLGWSSKDMDFLGGRQLTKEEIYLIYGLLPGMLDKTATEANATVADQIFKEKTVWPTLIRKAEQVTVQLVHRYYGKGFKLEYEDIRPRNRQMDINEVQQVGPYLTIDEVRQKYYGKGPLPEGRGEKTAAEVNRAAAAAVPAGGGLLDTKLPPDGMTPNGEGGQHVPEGSTIPEKGENAIDSNISAGMGIPKKALIPTLPILKNENGDGVLRDLKLWRGKVLKSMAKGGSALVKFSSDVLDKDLAADLADALGMCLSVAEVKTVFELVEGPFLRPEGVKAVNEQGSGNAWPSISGWASEQVRSWRPWSAFETRLLETVELGLRDQAEKIIEELRKGDAEAIAMSDTLWDEFKASMLKDIEGDLVDLANEAISRVKVSLGSGGPAVDINWNLINEDAVAWAKDNAARQVTNITETTRAAIKAEVSDWAKSGEPLDGLIGRVEGMTDGSGQQIFSPKRAELIATTEATDTFAAANDKAWQAAGYAPAIFRPAAHPKCRCYTQPTLLKDGYKGQVWYTVRDEMVCKKPITTPWGVVEGCSGLHGVCISEGPHAGEKVL